MMEIDPDHPVLVALTLEGCGSCDFMKPVVAEIGRENAAAKLEVVHADVWDDPQAVVGLQALSHPTFVLFVAGQEQARLAGPRTKRQMLRKLLPQLYADAEEATRQLQRQLKNPDETFPSKKFGGFALSSKSQKVEYLREVPLFATLSKRQLGQITKFADEVDVSAARVLAVQDEPGDQFHVIVRGSATVRRSGRKIAQLGPGDFFGEMSLLDGEPRSASVETDEDSVVMVIRRRDFDYCLNELPGLARSMLTTMSKRLREADRKLVG
ncbi:MAG: cyclic nucleotide-binding domain-containing protein [Acidimicrobiia bacterium]